MKKQTKLWLIAMFAIFDIYVVFLLMYSRNDLGDAPVITFDEPIIEVSVNDGKEKLLAGVHASDTEDGDLSKNLLIDSISAYDSSKQRTVTYACFDSMGNVTKAQRQITYNDYTKPRFHLTKSFSSSTNSIGNIANSIGAVSCVDGDISGKVNVKIGNTDDPDLLKVVISVKDSTGEGSSLELDYNYDYNNYTTDIKLNEYLVYVPVGGSFSAENNIKEIKTTSTSDAKTSKYLNINDTVDYSTPGVYEISYSFNYYGDIGFSKCIVVVE